MVCIEVVNVTYAYRVRLTRRDGHETWIGDWPTLRIALAEADRFIRSYMQ